MTSIYKTSITLIIMSFPLAQSLTISVKEECGMEGEIVSELDSECYLVGTQGPCEEGHMMVLNGRRGVCQERQCEDILEVEYKGECRIMFARGVCPTGERLYITLEGKAECECMEGWLRKYPMPYCYQQFTRGFCQPGNILKIYTFGKYGIAEKLKCIENPCSEGKLPHTDTWEKNGTCHQVNVGALEREDCEVEISKEDNSLVCTSKVLEMDPSSKKPKFEPSEQPLKSELDPSERPLKSELDPSEQPLKSELDPSEWPLKSELNPSERPLKAELNPSEQPLKSELDESEQPLKTELDLSEQPLLVPFSIAPVFQAIKCRRGRVWSKYRKKCVKIYRG